MDCPWGFLATSWAPNLKEFGWNVFAQHLFECLRLVLTVSVFGFDLNGFFLARFHPLKPIFQPWDEITLAMGVLEGIAALVGFDLVTLFIKQSVLDTDPRTVLNLWLHIRRCFRR